MSRIDFRFLASGGCLRCLLHLIALLGGLNACAAQAQAPPPAPQHVLLLYSYGYGGRGVELFSDGFFKAITEAGFPVNNVHAEYLDLQRNTAVPGYREQLTHALSKKYAQGGIDLIVTVQQPALEFLLSEGRDLAPQAPVITIQQRPLLEAEKTGRRIAGEINRFDIKGTLERALELFPQTRRVVFASGSSAADIKLNEEAARVAAAWQGRLEFEYTINMALDAILQRVARLPPHSIIIFTQYNVDTKGRVALAYEVENMLVRVANAPVFGLYDYNLKNGGIGGSVIAVEASGARTARLAIDILKGAAPAAGTLRVNESIPMFDWQQIQRWGGDASRLPANTVFVNRPPSAWEEHPEAIVATGAVILVLTALIATLLINTRRRKQAEASLRASEKRFHDIVNASADWIWEVDAVARYTYVSSGITTLLGYLPEEILGKTPFDLMLPAEAARVRPIFAEITAKGLPFRNLDNINLHKDGSQRYVLTNGMPIRDASGQVIGYRGLDMNITEKKQAEIALLQQTEEVRQRNEELERFNRASVGRELDMIGLKQQVNELCRQLGRDPPYPLAFLDRPAMPPGEGETQ
ncbi:MAG: PAS domain S-box protein [Betaproteobacteria bacterium]|nr:PAS domain S-box protein [Betaproteobacteria bacterium]